MICKNCGVEVSEGVNFCQNCGEKVEGSNVKKFCSGCGIEIKNDSNFCPKCGKSIISKNENNDTQLSSVQKTSKANNSVWFTAISAFICLIIRLTSQETYYSWSDFVDNRKVVGLDSNIKPFITIIPIIAIIISVLMIVNDKVNEKQKKTNAIIVNLILFALALLFVWFDIPYSIIDF